MDKPFSIQLNMFSLAHWHVNITIPEYHQYKIKHRPQFIHTTPTWHNVIELYPIHAIYEPQNLHHIWEKPNPITITRLQYFISDSVTLL